jgi:ketosteroid isomerase-like protein
MTLGKVELARTLVERWNAGRRGLADIEELCDPGAEMESPLSQLSGEPYRGYAGMERWVEDLEKQFSEWHISVEEAREVGDRVIVISAVRARGRASGVALEFRSAAVLSFAADTRLLRVRIYAEVQEALRAVGLEPDEGQ